MANLLYQSLQPGLEEELYTDAAYAAAAASLNSADESLPYSTSELNAPEYSTDDFRMFQFKVARCSKRYVHDWRACPFAHPTENARRRDPRLVKYLPVPCPDYKRGICLRGDSCTYSHGVYECWLHPAKYRTQLCKEGPNCRRPVCFFAHSVLDLRQPSHMYADGGAAGRPPPEAATHHTGGSGPRASADASFGRLSSEEALNNFQGGEGRGSPTESGLAAGPGAGSSAAAALLAHSPASRQSSASLTRSSSEGRPAGSAPHSPNRSGSPGATPALPDAAVQRAADAAAAAAASDAATAMAVLTQQQQAQAQAAAAQAAAALARLSMDGRASMDASAAATTQAMLHAGAAALPPRMSLDGTAALPPRMSLDSLLATRQQAAAAGWAPAPAPAPAPTAAAALAAGPSALPLNEQPFPSGNAPRMSNAVARKLGLAPQRSSLDARLTKLRGAATPPRSSIDGILHALHHSSARSSLDQQQAMLQAMSPAQLQAMALNGGGPHMQAQLGGYGPPGYGAAPPGGYALPPGAGPVGPDGMALHPALLSLVAAQMAPQQMQGGMPGMPPPGVPNGMHSGLGSQHGHGGADMAALMDSLSGWQVGGGGGPAMAHHHHHRASMDSVNGMAGPPNMHSAQSGGYYDAKGIWGSHEAINNQAGAE